MLTALMRGSSRWPVLSGSAGMMILWESAGIAGFLRLWMWVPGAAAALGGADPPLTHRQALCELELCLHASSLVEAARRLASCRQVLEAHQAGPQNARGMEVWPSSRSSWLSLTRSSTVRRNRPPLNVTAPGHTGSPALR